MALQRWRSCYCRGMKLDRLATRLGHWRTVREPLSDVHPSNFWCDHQFSWCGFCRVTTASSSVDPPESYQQVLHVARSADEMDVNWFEGTEIPQWFCLICCPRCSSTCRRLGSCHVQTCPCAVDSHHSLESWRTTRNYTSRSFVWTCLVQSLHN